LRPARQVQRIGALAAGPAGATVALDEHVQDQPLGRRIVAAPRAQRQLAATLGQAQELALGRQRRLEVGTVDPAPHVENGGRIVDESQADRIPLLLDRDESDPEVACAPQLFVNFRPAPEAADRADHIRPGTGSGEALWQEAMSAYFLLARDAESRADAASARMPRAFRPRPGRRR